MGNGGVFEPGSFNLIRITSSTSPSPSAAPTTLTAPLITMFISSFLVPFVALGACVLAVPAVSDTPHDRKWDVFWLTGHILTESPPASAAYDLTRSGAGGYPIEPPNLLTHLDTRGTPKHSRDLAASGPPPQSDSPPRFDGTCMYDERHEVIAALAVSRAYLTAAIEYLESRNDKALYKRWFGAYDRRRAGIVLHTLTWIRNEVIVVTPFSCACTLQNRPSWCTYIFQSWNRHSATNDALE